MRQRQVRWGAMLLVLVASAAHAQDADEGWQVSVDALHVVTRGNDVHVGDVFTERQTLSGTFSDSRFDYGVEYDPIVTRMRDNRSGMVTVVYRSTNWGGGIRGWRSESEAAVDGARRTAVPTASSQSITGIRLWDNSVLPVTNLLEPSGISPVTFTAENSLSTVRAEGFAERRWIRGPRLSVAARVGVAHARVENARAEGQTQRAFVQETEGGITTTLFNDIRIDSASESTVNLTGPMFALAGNTTAGRLRIEWLIGQSVLLGTAETSGEWRDVDNIRETTSGAAPPIETRTVLSGLIETSQEERALVPVMELQLKAAVRVTRALALGGGVFSSTWFTLPVAPAFSIPDDWTDLQGTGWRQQTRDVTFAGVSISASIGF
jgi:hypothetical protein